MSLTVVWHGVTLGATGAERCSNDALLCVERSASYLCRFDADDEVDDHANLLTACRNEETGTGV